MRFALVFIMVQWTPIKPKPAPDADPMQEVYQKMVPSGLAPTVIDGFASLDACMEAGQTLNDSIKSHDLLLGYACLDKKFKKGKR